MQSQPLSAGQDLVPRHDQNGGDFYPFLVRLATLLPPDGAEMPIPALLLFLREKDPATFSAVDELLQRARSLTGLSDAEADRWRQKGNEEFSQDDWSGCVLSYTNGLLSAESEGVRAALLNNRSTALLHKKRVADACLDAHRAVVLRPDYWKALRRRGRCLEALGFHELGAKDVAAADSETAAAANTSAEMEKLFGEVGTGLVEHSLPPRARLSAPVKLQRSAKGRGLVAMERLEGGRTVLAETPYALVARAEALLSVCSYCLQFTSCLYQGEPHHAHGTKSRGFFCSSACAAAAWQHYDERESRHPFFLCCPNDALLAYRLMRGEQQFHTLTEMKGFPDDFDTVSKNNFGADHMRTLEGSWSKELASPQTAPPPTDASPSTIHDVGGYESVVACLALHVGAVDGPMEAERLRKAQRQILLNAFNVQCTLQMSSETDAGGNRRLRNSGGLSKNSASDGGDEDRSQMVTSKTTAVVGKALYAIGALFNHACDPNCYASFLNNPQGSSPELVVRTIRPVMEGEELTIAYGGIDRYHFHSMRHRLRTLRDRYGFICRCSTCMNQVDEPVNETNKQYYITAADYYQKGKRMLREGKLKTAVTVLLQSYEIVMRHICPPPEKPQMMVPKTHDALALAYFYLGDSAKCAEHLKAALDTDIAVHGDNDNRVELIDAYTRLAFVAQDEDEKKLYADKAVTLLRRFYAPSAMLELQVAYTESSYKKAQEHTEGGAKEEEHAK